MITASEKMVQKKSKKDDKSKKRTNILSKRRFNAARAIS